jgi:hypothetical protein
MEHKTEIPGIFRDESGALINKDNKSLLMYKKRKEESRRILKIERDLEILSSDIKIIKEMIKEIQHSKGHKCL